MEDGVLRVIHIVTGVTWAGTAMFMGWFLVPAVQEAGSAGGAVMGALMRRGLSHVLMVVSLLCVLSGLRLYMLAVTPTGLVTGQGLILTVGGLLALAAWLLGLAVHRPTALRVSQLSEAIRAAGGPPKLEQTAELARLARKSSTASRWSAGLLAGSTLLMAASRLGLLV